MSNRKHILALTLTAALAAMALPATQAHATGAVYIAPAAAGAPWPVWALGGGGVSLMLRAAYVYRTECRELTGAEAFGGMVTPWPLYHQARNQCAPAARAPIVGRY